MKHEMNADISFLPEEYAFVVVRNDEGNLTDCYADAKTPDEVARILQFAVEFAYNTAIEVVGNTKEEAASTILRIVAESIQKSR